MGVNPYNYDFYNSLLAGAQRSAREIAPLVVEWIRPRQVVDVGCGVGAWLSVVRECGVEEILGLDGAYVVSDLLQIPEECFLAVNLNQPPALEREFDLVMSLEVAEHLPPERAADFVEYLTGLGPVVLFSAAVPHQGGDNHLNEQWPEYWAALFQARDFVAVDALRRRFWRNENVESWYAQNMLLYVRRTHSALERLRAEAHAWADDMPLPLVHPRLYQHKQHVAMELQAELDPRSRSLKEVLSWLPSLLRKALAAKLRPWRTKSLPGAFAQKEV